MAKYLIFSRNVRQMMAQSMKYRNSIIWRNKLYSTSENNERLLIRNVFQDNPAAKYWVLGGLAISVGITYYVYNDQRKKKLVLDILPPRPSHYCLPRDDEVKQLKVLLENGKQYPKEVQILGPSGSGKTQIARMLAESLNESRRESFQFKLWPKDEVTVCLHGHSKHTLLLGLKQLAAKLGCSEDEVKLDLVDLDSQLNVLSQGVQNKLKQQTKWILVIDNYNKQLKKWLPDSDWGNGYVIYTNSSQGINDLNNEDKIASFDLNKLNDESAKQLFQNVVNEGDVVVENESFPKKLFKLLQYNPISLVYAAIYFKHQVEQNNSYSYHNLFCDIENTNKHLKEDNPATSELLNVQTCCVTLAAKIMGESSPKIVHVFDFLGSCNPNHVIPFDVLLCHLNIPEFHIQLEPDTNVAQENQQPIEDVASNIKVSADLEAKQSVWSFHGVVSKVIEISDRIKLEIDALKSLFGYGGGLFASENKPPPDDLEFVRTNPLLTTSKEPRTGIEVLSSHPIVHNVFRQLFPNVTIPLLEKQHLIIAKRKYQQKSYFARLQRFDPHKVIGEYRKSLGDNVSVEERENCLPVLKGTPSIGIFLSDYNTTENQNNEPTSKHPNIIGHTQEHFNRVVNSISNYYRMAGSDDKGMVAKALLLPHLEILLNDHQLTAASKGKVYQTMARICSDVLADPTTSKHLLNETFVVYQHRYGENSFHMACLLEQQAELFSMSDEPEKSKALLERAVNIHQNGKKTTQTSEQSFEYGKALVALGVTCGGLGETGRSKDLLEKGLMELQNAAPANPHAKENKWFAAEISSAVTSLGHSYLSLGNITQGRKLLELALIGHQNAHGDFHNEVIRALTTLSIAHTMQGNAQESKRLRNEAGKIKKKLDMRSPLFLT